MKKLLLLVSSILAANNVIFINGPYNSGKAAIAIELQKQLNETYLNINNDWFLQALPTKLNKTEDENLKASINPVINAFLDAKNNLIIDEHILTEEDLNKYLKSFKDHNVIFIGTHTPATEKQGKATHKLLKYDLFIDTNDSKPADSAKKIIRSLANHKNRALKKMAAIADKKQAR